MAVLSPSEEDLAVLASAAPMMPGAEYLTLEVLGAPWEQIGAAFSAEQADSGATVQEFLKGLNPAWNVVGGVHINLADKRKNEEAPFASSHLHEPALGLFVWLCVPPACPAGLRRYSQFSPSTLSRRFQYIFTPPLTRG